MLQITVPGTELWDEAKEQFVPIKEQKLQLEHSLVSVSKWESKWHKPFLLKSERTQEESLDYVRCMTLTQNVDPKAYYCLTANNFDEINRYIDDPMTATTFSEEEPGRKNHEVFTAEVIYFLMIAHGIPVEFQKWHLNRLITLIRVCEIKSKPPKKRSQGAIARRNTALNNHRRKRLNTRG